MNNVDKQYFDLLRTVLDEGTKKADRTGIGTISRFGHTMRFNMAEGFPLLTSKKIYTKAMFHELLWFIKGGDNIKYLVDNGVRIWNEWPHAKYNQENPDNQLSMEEFVEKVKADDEFARVWGDLGPVYGKQWVDWHDHHRSGSWEGVNQLDQVIDALKNNPDSRRIMVSAWNPADLPYQLLPPCHYAWQVWSRELTEEEKAANPGKVRALSLMFQMRSVDCFLGMPFDIASYAGLLHLIAHCTDMVPDELLVNSGDTHIYLNHLEQVNEQLSREPYEKLPTLTINTDTKNIYEIGYDDLVINDYQCHPSIKAEVAV